MQNAPPVCTGGAFWIVRQRLTRWLDLVTDHAADGSATDGTDRATAGQYTADDRTGMLGVIGAADIDALFVDVPAAARKTELFDLPRHAGEMEVERELAALSAMSRAAGA
eukprot:gene36907-60109_t